MIISWATFWPISILWDIISKPWEHLYNLFIGVYQGISNWVYNKNSDCIAEIKAFTEEEK
jgi:hypothetical protein